MGLPDLSDLTAGAQGGGGLPALDDLLRGETDSAPQSPAVGTQRTLPPPTPIPSFRIRLRQMGHPEWQTIDAPAAQAFFDEQKDLATPADHVQAAQNANDFGTVVGQGLTDFWNSTGPVKGAVEGTLQALDYGLGWGSRLLGQAAAGKDLALGAAVYPEFQPEPVPGVSQVLAEYAPMDEQFIERWGPDTAAALIAASGLAGEAMTDPDVLGGFGVLGKVRGARKAASAAESALTADRARRMTDNADLRGSLGEEIGAQRRRQEQGATRQDRAARNRGMSRLRQAEEQVAFEQRYGGAEPDIPDSLLPDRRPIAEQLLMRDRLQNVPEVPEPPIPPSLRPDPRPIVEQLAGRRRLPSVEDLAREKYGDEAGLGPEAALEQRIRQQQVEERLRQGQQAEEEILAQRRRVLELGESRPAPDRPLLSPPPAQQGIEVTGTRGNVRSRMTPSQTPVPVEPDPTAAEWAAQASDRAPTATPKMDWTKWAEEKPDAWLTGQHQARAGTDFPSKNPTLWAALEAEMDRRGILPRPAPAEPRRRRTRAEMDRFLQDYAAERRARERGPLMQRDPFGRRVPVEAPPPAAAQAPMAEPPAPARRRPPLPETPTAPRVSRQSGSPVFLDPPPPRPDPLAVPRAPEPSPVAPERPGGLEVVRQGRGPVRSRQTFEPAPAAAPARPTAPPPVAPAAEAAPATPPPQAPEAPAAPAPGFAPGAKVRVNNPEAAALHNKQGTIVRRAGTDAPDGTPIWFVQIGKRQTALPETSLRGKATNGKAARAAEPAAPANASQGVESVEPAPANAQAGVEPEAPAATPGAPIQEQQGGGGGTRQQRQAAAPSTPEPRGNLDIAPSRQQPAPRRPGAAQPAVASEPLPPAVGTVHGQTVQIGADTYARRIPLHGLVRLAKELTGQVPSISEALQRLSKKLNGEVRGRFLGGNNPRIQLNPDIFASEQVAGKVLAHEIGHLVDFLPDGTFKRGNVLGHLLTLRKSMAKAFGSLVNAELRKELQELSAWWRPWDPKTAGPKYRAYRGDAKELYADALSVMLNDMDEFQRRAPKFAAAFFKHLDRKPNVQQALVDVHDFLSGTMDDVVEGLSRDVQGGFLKAETLWQRMREEAAAREGSIWERLRQQFQALHGAVSFHLSDVGGDIKRRAQRLENTGVDIPEHLDPRVFFDELNWNASGYRLAQEWDRKVQAPIRNAGVDEATVGELMFAERILGDRKDLANPFGITKETAPAVLDRLRKNATPQQWQAMQEASKAARELYWQALEEAVDAGIISRQRLAELEVTKDSYATFAVVDFLGDKIPENLKQATGLTSGQPRVGAAIKHQKGTFREIANPLTATFMKGLSQRTWNAHNRARRGVIGFMKQYFPDEVVEAKRVGEGQFEKPAHRDLREYQVWEDGERKVYHVHKDLADIFDAQPHHKAMMIAKLISAPDHAFFRPLWLTYNAGFQAVNVVRDLGRTARAWAAVGADSGLPGARGRVLNEYRKVWGEAWEYARGRDSALAEAMMDEGALMPPGETFSAQMLGDSQTDALIRQRLGIGEERSLFQRTVGGFLRVLADAGSALEAVPKMASYKRLADRTSLSPEVRAHVVRNYVGTPNILTRGASTQITNRFLMFSNVMLQGLKSNLNTLAPATMRGLLPSGSRMAVPGASPMRAWVRTVQQAFLPKVLMTAGTLGFFGKDIKEGYDYMSSYFKQQFLAVPIGWEEGGPHGKRVVALTLPQDEMDRLLTGMLYVAAKRDRPGFQAWLEDELGFIKGQMTPDLGPSMRLGLDALAVASGKNPEDDFRGQPAIPAQEFEAGGWPRWRGFLRWKSSELGMPGDLIKTYAFRDDANRPLVQTWAANVPGLNRFIRVTDYGKSEEQRLAKDMEDQAKAQRRVGYGESTRYVYGQYWSLRNIKNRTPAQERAYQEASDFYNGTYRPGDEDVHEAETRKNEARAKSKKAQMERDAARARQRINRYLGRKA